MNKITMEFSIDEAKYLQMLVEFEREKFEAIDLNKYKKLNTNLQMLKTISSVLEGKNVFSST